MKKCVIIKIKETIVFVLTFYLINLLYRYKKLNCITKILCGCDTDAMYIVLVDQKESASMIQKMKKTKKCRVLILYGDKENQNNAKQIIVEKSETNEYWNNLLKEDNRPLFTCICPKPSEIVAGIKNNMGEYLKTLIEERKPDVILTGMMYGTSQELLYAGWRISRFVREKYKDIPVMLSYCDKFEELSGIYLMDSANEHHGFQITLTHWLDKFAKKQPK